jgi:hypothetical protein
MKLRRPPKTLNEILLEQMEQRQAPPKGDVLPTAADPEGPVRVETSAAAVRFLGTRGGRAYVWADGAGLLRTTVRPPSGVLAFVRHPAEGFELYQDAGIPTPPLWKLRRRLFPPGVVALWNGSQGSAEGGG